MRADSSKYRIIKRGTLLGLALGLGIVALALPTVLYFSLERFRARIAISGGDVSTLSLQLLIYANSALFLIPAVVLFWYASRALRTGTFPPPGSWALEGQQVHLGSSHSGVRALIVFAAAACCLAIGAAWIALALTIRQLGQT